METRDIISIIAILVSPAIAVWVSMRIQDRRDKMNFKRTIFATLMATRPQAYSDEIVRALNMIDVAFYDNDSVRKLWKEYVEMLNNEGLNNPKGWEQQNIKRTELVHEIAKSIGLGKEISHLDLKRCYLPIGLAVEHQKIKNIGDELLRVLKESHGIMVTQKEQSEKKGNQIT